LSGQGVRIKTPISLIFLVCASSLVMGCAREKHLDVEPLAEGGYIMRAHASTWRQSKDAAREAVAANARTYCRLEGRDAVIKDIKTKQDPVFATEAAQAEFDCPPPPSRKPRE
jgi:hypothetical protein